MGQMFVAEYLRVSFTIQRRIPSRILLMLSWPMLWWPLKTIGPADHPRKLVLFIRLLGIISGVRRGSRGQELGRHHPGSVQPPRGNFEVPTKHLSGLPFCCVEACNNEHCHCLESGLHGSSDTVSSRLDGCHDKRASDIMVYSILRLLFSHHPGSIPESASKALSKVNPAFPILRESQLTVKGLLPAIGLMAAARICSVFLSPGW